MKNKPEKPQLSIPLINGNFYLVRPFHNDEFEPAKCKSYNGTDKLYFFFTNGSRMEVERAWEVEPLNMSINEHNGKAKDDSEINDEAIGYASHNDPNGNINPEGYSEKQIGLLHGFIDGYKKCQKDNSENSSSEINKYKLAIEVQENTIKNFKRKIIENSGRDNDILKLSEAVLNASPNCWDNPNGAYETTCPFCDVTEHRGGGKGSVWASMSELQHKQECAYLIAKDLSTGLL